MYTQEYYQKNKQQLDRNAKRWRQRNKQQVAEIMRRLHYRRRYNSTIADYDFHYTIQGGCCACCGRTDNYRNQYFDMDHDHSTGELRGLLCNRCNRMVGLVEHCCDLPTYGVNENMKKKVESYLTGRVLFAKM